MYTGHGVRIPFGWIILIALAGAFVVLVSNPGHSMASTTSVNNVVATADLPSCDIDPDIASPIYRHADGTKTVPSEWDRNAPDTVEYVGVGRIHVDSTPWHVWEEKPSGRYVLGGKHFRGGSGTIVHCIPDSGTHATNVPPKTCSKSSDPNEIRKDLAHGFGGPRKFYTVVALDDFSMFVTYGRSSWDPSAKAPKLGSFVAPMQSWIIDTKTGRQYAPGDQVPGGRSYNITCFK